MLFALLLAFLTGWLMGADFPPPHTKDISFNGAAWLVIGAVSVAMGLMFSASGKRG